jgi:hypothetical protein
MFKYGKILCTRVFCLLFSVIFSGCAAAPSSYDSFSHRDSEFQESELAMPGNGLDRDTIGIILSTKFPPENKVSVAIMFLYEEPRSKLLGIFVG